MMKNPISTFNNEISDLQASASEFLKFEEMKSSQGSEINQIKNPHQNSTPRGFFTGENALSEIELATSNNAGLDLPTRILHP